MCIVAVLFKTDKGCPKPWFIIDDFFGAGKVGFNELRGWSWLDYAKTMCRLDLHQILRHVLPNIIFHIPLYTSFLHAEKEQVLLMFLLG